MWCDCKIVNYSPKKKCISQTNKVYILRKEEFFNLCPYFHVFFCAMKRGMAILFLYVPY